MSYCRGGQITLSELYFTMIFLSPLKLFQFGDSSEKRLIAKFFLFLPNISELKKIFKILLTSYCRGGQITLSELYFMPILLIPLKLFSFVDSHKNAKLPNFGSFCQISGKKETVSVLFSRVIMKTVKIHCLNFILIYPASSERNRSLRVESF